MKIFQNNQHQSNGKQEMRIHSKPTMQQFNQEKEKQCNLYPKRDA